MPKAYIVQLQSSQRNAKSSIRRNASRIEWNKQSVFLFRLSMLESVKLIYFTLFRWRPSVGFSLVYSKIKMTCLKFGRYSLALSISFFLCSFFIYDGGGDDDHDDGGDRNSDAHPMYFKRISSLCSGTSEKERKNDGTVRERKRDAEIH